METLNVSADDKSSVDAFIMDVVVPLKFSSEISSLPILECQQTLRDLRSDKVRKVGVLVVKDEYLTDKIDGDLG